MRIVFTAFKSLQKLPLIVLAVFLSACAHKSEARDLRTGEKLTPEILGSVLPARGTIVLGEHHYSVPIQKAQADIIRAVVQSHKAEGRFTVGWEFLDYPKNEKIQELMKLWTSNAIDEEEFTLRLFGSKESAKNHQSYFPIFRAIKDLGGELIATNAPREWKRIVTSKGLAALPAEYIPGEIRTGSNFYFERFKQIMQGHVKEDELIRYFEAQYYTDSAMAHSMEKLSTHELRFLVVGSFHSDYQDGVVRELTHYSKDIVTNIKVIDVSEMSEEEIAEMNNPHPKYGKIADFVYMIR